MFLLFFSILLKTGHGYGYNSLYGVGYNSPAYGYSPALSAKTVLQSPVISSSIHGLAASHDLRYAGAVSPVAHYGYVSADTIKPLQPVVAKPIIAKQVDYYVSICKKKNKTLRI